MRVYASMTVKVFGGIFHVIAEILKHLKDTLAFSSCLAFYNRYRFLLASDLLPNISLVVGQSSVNLSLALSASDISTTDLQSVIY